MKKSGFLFVTLLMLMGCTAGVDLYNDSGSRPAENPTAEQSETLTAKSNLAHLFAANPGLDKNLKDELEELQTLWVNFKAEESAYTDAVKDFKKSEYLAKLKTFLGNRESLVIAISDLAKLLEQYNLISIEKKLSVGEKEYDIRVISYTVDYCTKDITGIYDIPDKWIFVQCWNRDEFYFTTLSDGGIHTATDFIPLEINNTPQIVVTGYSSPCYPKPPFLWAWRLEEDVFIPSKLFDFDVREADTYFIYEDIEFYSDRCQYKWTFQTNGSYLFAEKQFPAEENELWISNRFNIFCRADNENNAFVFTSADRKGTEDSTIQIVFSNNKFVIEQ